MNTRPLGHLRVVQRSGQYAGRMCAAFSGGSIHVEDDGTVAAIFKDGSIIHIENEDVLRDLSDVAAKAIAYWTLTKDVSRFPEQTDIWL